MQVDKAVSEAEVTAGRRQGEEARAEAQRRTASAGALSFPDRLEIGFLHFISQQSIKSALNLRVLIAVCWSFGALKCLYLLSQARTPGHSLRLCAIILAVLAGVVNAAWMRKRLRAPSWKRVHDERVKLWSWKLMLVATLINSVLHIEGENKMASPLGNSILMSTTVVFEQIRLQIALKLVAVQLVAMHLMEVLRWYTMAAADSGAVWHDLVRDTVLFVLLGAAGPLACITLIEARARLKFLKTYGKDTAVLHPFWQRLLKAQSLM